MKRISAFFYAKTNLVISIILTIAMGAYAALVMGGQSECFQSQLDEGLKVFGLTFGLTMEYALNVFSSLNNEGLLCYKELILIWDNIFPILYSLMYVFWLSWIYKRIRFNKGKNYIINIFPFVPAIVDWIENVFELRLVNFFIDNQDLIISHVQISSFISQFKWICSYCNYAIILIGIIILIYQTLANRKIINR